MAGGNGQGSGSDLFVKSASVDNGHLVLELTDPRPDVGGVMSLVLDPGHMTGDESRSMRRLMLSGVSARKVADISGVAARNVTRVIRALSDNVDVLRGGASVSGIGDEV